jgi:small GTP-binding protein
MYNSLSSSNTVSKIKLVLIGNSAAGKTCIVQRIVNNIFNVNNGSTIGAAYMMYGIDKNLKIEMWDTAGQERFYSLLPMYARGAEVIIIVVDIEKSIEEQFVKWSKYIEDNKKLFLPHFKLFLIFNKCDLNTKFQIPNVILEQTQFIYISIVSAKSSHNIDKLKTYLEVVAKKIVEERATHTHLHLNSNSNVGNNGNIGDNKNDNFGSKFSNININISEYGDKIKKYYDATHC